MDVKQTAKIGAGKAGPGRPKGVPNKLGRVAKDTIAQVFEDVGGIEGMAEWARENRTAFYGIYSKLLPLQVDGAGENGEHLANITVTFVKPDAG